METYKVFKKPVVEEIAVMVEKEELLIEALSVVKEWVKNLTNGTWDIVNEGCWIMHPYQCAETTQHIVDSTHIGDDLVEIKIYKITGYSYAIKSAYYPRRNK